MWTTLQGLRCEHIAPRLHVLEPQRAGHAYGSASIHITITVVDWSGFDPSVNASPADTVCFAHVSAYVAFVSEDSKHMPDVSTRIFWHVHGKCR